MPKKVINYSNTIIYKLVCKDLDIKDCYVGHTTNFTKRRCEHKNKTEKCSKPYVYEFLGTHGGFDNWDMIEVERYEGTDRLDVLKRERFWIESLGATLNKNIPTRTVKEYNDDHKEEHKQYYEANKEKIISRVTKRATEKQNEISDYQKQYYLKHTIRYNCPCGGRYTNFSAKVHMGSVRHKQYENTL